MIAVNPKYIVDNEGKKISVILPIKDFKAIMEKILSFMMKLKNPMSRQFLLIKLLKRLKPSANAGNGLSGNIKETSHQSS